MSADHGHDRVVLVTGGSRGIGRACAQWFLANGDRVAVTSRSAPEDGLGGEAPERFLSITCDVTDPVGVEQAFTTI